MIPIAELSSTSDLEAALLEPGPLLLLKHSTRCEVSTQAHAEYRRFAERAAPGRVRLALIKIVEHRDVSNLLAERLGVRHESPQALLVLDGREVWNASHWDITEQSLGAALEAHAAAG